MLTYKLAYPSIFVRRLYNNLYVEKEHNYMFTWLWHRDSQGRVLGRSIFNLEFQIINT